MTIKGEDLPFLKASLFFTQFKNQLILDYEENQIYRGTDSIYASAVRFGNESHRYLSWQRDYHSYFYSWKRKYAGMDAQQLKELKSLQEENRRLKQMYADLSLDHRILKDIIEKKL